MQNGLNDSYTDNLMNYINEEQAIIPDPTDRYTNNLINYINQIRNK